MKQLSGDLIAMALAGRFDVIVHGCNCFHAMGAGIARAIADQFPEAQQADLATPFGARQKLGDISCAQLRRGTNDITIVNAYTQFHWQAPDPEHPAHPNGALVDLDAISACFRKIAARFAGARIGYPRIGAGLARGNWQQIAPLIDAALSGLDHCLVTLPAPTSNLSETS